MPVFVFSFDFVVTSGTLVGQRGTEDFAYAFEPIGDVPNERRYRAYRVSNLGAEGSASTAATLARTYARDFAGQHGNIRLDAASPRSWPLFVPPPTSRAG